MTLREPTLDYRLGEPTLVDVNKFTATYDKRNSDPNAIHRESFCNLLKKICTQIEKVKRRLKLWANRPHQINSRILTTYLKLEKAEVSPITEEKLRAAMQNEPSFSSNFLQMKISAEKNHGVYTLVIISPVIIIILVNLSLKPQIASL